MKIETGKPTSDITFGFATRDDCLGKMVPSDLRLLVGERDRLLEQNEKLRQRLMKHFYKTNFVQWFKNGDHPLDYAAPTTGFEDGELAIFSSEHQKKMGWEGQSVRYYRTPECDGQNQCEKCGITMHYHGWLEDHGPEQFDDCGSINYDPPKIVIDTLEGVITASPDDFIIQGVQGEFYPCKPDIFEATYEPVGQEQDHE